MNVNVNIQYDSSLEEYEKPRPLTFAQIASIRNDVNAPPFASFTATEADYGWEINIHWNTDVRMR